MRKLMVKYVSNSVDIVNHNGSSMRITTVNAKTSWTRTLTEGKEITQVQPVCCNHINNHRPGLPVLIIHLNKVLQAASTPARKAQDFHRILHVNEHHV